MSSTLSIAGSVVTPGPGSRIVMDRLTISMDRPDELEFHELACNLPGTYHPEQPVTLLDGSSPVFSGWIYSRHPDGYGTGPGTVGYRCLGLSYGAALVAVTASDGTGTMSFNLPVTDPNYAATEAGLSVGTIISQVLAQHSTQFGAIGISTDSTTTSQLAALTVVSPDPVYISGNSLWTQLQQLLQQWYGSRYALRIDYGLSGSTVIGLVRCWDTYGMTSETITLGSDPAILASMSEDTSECYTQVILRGRDDVEPAFLSLHDGTLVGEATSGGGWTPTQQGSWNWSDFQYPQNAYDQGGITAETSTVVTIQSDYPATHWATNYWNGIQGTISVINPIVSTLAGFQETRHIIACSALSAGGTATITLDRPLASSGYTRYQIVGQPGGLNNVWRKFVIKNTWVAQHLVQQFNYAVPWGNGMNSVSMVTTPIAVVGYTANAGGAGLQLQAQVPIEIVPYDGTNDGYILAYRPIVEVNNTPAQLNQGGASVSAPTDFICMVPYSRGALTVASPSGGGYSGTAYTLFGVQRTLYRDYPNWLDRGNVSNMQTLADNILATVSNAVQEGSVTYVGKYTTALPSGSWPIRLSIASASGTTGYESMAAPVRTVTLMWPQEGGSPWVTGLNFSTRRQMYSGDRLYVHPMYMAGNPMASAESGEVIRSGVAFGGVVNAFEAGGEAPTMEFGDDGPGRYQKPSERHAAAVRDKRRRDEAADSATPNASERHDAAVRGKRERDAAAARADDAREGAVGLADKARRDRNRGPRLETTEAERDLVARGNDLTNPERADAIGSKVDADNRRRRLALESPEERQVRMAYNLESGEERSS